jgi:hypothetical protein
LRRRNAGDDLDLVALGARREQGITGVDINGYRGQSGHADGHEEVSNFHVLFFNFWWRFIAPPNGCICITPAGWKSRKFFLRMKS